MGIPKSQNRDEFLADFNTSLSNMVDDHGSDDEVVKYLQEPAPNIIEWVTGVKYWNVPSTYGYWRQYQILRDAFMVRCPLCNSNKPEDIDCWDKTRMQLESEVLLVWDKAEHDFVCPKCRTTQRELIEDEFISPYNELIVLAGMRSGKSYLGAHIGGYFEHMLITWGMQGRGSLQRMLMQEKSEWFEVTFSASTAEQAQNTIYAKYRGMRKNSPWLQKYMAWVTKKEKAQGRGVKDGWAYKLNDRSVDDGWLQVRFNRVASDSSGVAGRTRIFASIDEWARLINSDGTRSAIELYAVLNNSLKTVRASVMLNKLPAFLGMMANVTSPIAQDDPAMMQYNKTMAGDLPMCYAWKGPTWEFNPFVPRSVFDGDYARDPIIAERDFGANPPLAATPFIDDPQRFWRCIDWAASPMVDYSFDLITDPTGKKYVGATADKCLVDAVNNYYVFADAGKSWDAFSIVIGRPVWVRAEDSVTHDEVVPSEARVIPLGGSEVIMPGSSPDVMQAPAHEGRFIDHQQSSHQLGGAYGDMLVTEIVSAMRIVPTQDREIWFDSLVKILKFLKSKIRIVEFGCDTWNSTQAVQSIRDMGIPAKEITLRIDDFMAFKNLSYNGRVRLLPPMPDDHVELKPNGILTMGVPQVQLQGPSVALVELLKLNRSEDLKHVFNAKKGLVRGQDSDDLARSVIGVNHLIQTSVVDARAKDAKQQQTLQRLKSMENEFSGGVFVPRNK